MIKQKIKKAVQFIINPHLLICFGIAWLITNGWSYLLFGIGTYYDIGWMVAISGAYLTLLWLPISPEKIVTVAIAIGLLRIIFPRDEKTLRVLTDMKNAVVDAIDKKRNKKRNKSKGDCSLGKKSLADEREVYKGTPSEETRIK